MLNNVFKNIPAELPDELFETLAFSDDIKIERIISRGHVTPVGNWYDQDWDEWVVLLQGQACISYENGDNIELEKGDFVLLPAHCKHRVERTSVNQDCIWLAVHYKPTKTATFIS